MCTAAPLAQTSSRLDIPSNCATKGRASCSIVLSKPRPCANGTIHATTNKAEFMPSDQLLYNNIMTV
jgi:hypothetical protein